MKTCAKCGNENPSSALHCMKCGNLLVEEDALSEEQKLQKKLQDAEKEKELFKAAVEAILKGSTDKNAPEEIENTSSASSFSKDLEEGIINGKCDLTETEKNTKGISGPEGISIRGTDKGNDSAPSSSNNPSRKRTIIAATIITVVLLCGGLFLLPHNHDKTEELATCISNANFPDENRIRNVVSIYCTAICENDFETLASIYAPTVLRYQDAYNKDRDFVIGCHQRYDNTFKVYGKHSSIRWDSFRMNLASNGTVNAILFHR